jgi:hypothetical protein
MAAHSDSSSDPTQSVGSTAAGAHAAPADQTIPRADATTTAQPVVDRTPTTSGPTLPAAAAAPVGSRHASTQHDDRHDETRRDGTGRDEHVAPTGKAARQRVVAAQKERYGGVSWGAAFFGWLTANGMAVILIALLSAGGLAFGLSEAVDSADEAADSATSGIGLGAGIALLVVFFLAYLAGGYVAGRMARFDGVKQGIAVWVIGLVVVILLALAGLVFGSQYNVLAQLDLPRIPVDEGTATTAGIIALVAVLVATLLGAVLGGMLGARYHRKVDRVGFDAV